ncbi:MAG: hypothetical protein HS116_05165 [Planctomycetes bacterium]|nr:hypothetical protein [Planctomycetota bacterium]
MAEVYKRSSRAAGREIRRALSARNAAEALGEKDPVADAEARALAGDGGKYFGSGPVSNDLRRAGWSTSKGKVLE